MVKNNEFLVDQTLINGVVDQREYQYALLNNSIGQQNLAMVNGFSKGLIKKRIKMMNKRKSRRYTKEFKLEALELLKTSGKSGSEIERELGITGGLIYKWRDRYQVKIERDEVQLEPSDLAAAQAEVKRLRRELKIAREERDILKKAVAIISEGPKTGSDL